jgi:hypothetical protein
LFAGKGLAVSANSTDRTANGIPAFVTLRQQSKLRPTDHESQSARATRRTVRRCIKSPAQHHIPLSPVRMQHGYKSLLKRGGVDTQGGVVYTKSLNLEPSQAR